jgi:hypothetical protein
VSKVKNETGFQTDGLSQKTNPPVNCVTEGIRFANTNGNKDDDRCNGFSKGRILSFVTRQRFFKGWPKEAKLIGLDLTAVFHRIG